MVFQGLRPVRDAEPGDSTGDANLPRATRVDLPGAARKHDGAHIKLFQTALLGRQIIDRPKRSYDHSMPGAAVGKGGGLYEHRIQAVEQQVAALGVSISGIGKGARLQEVAGIGRWHRGCGCGALRQLLDNRFIRTQNVVRAPGEGGRLLRRR